MWRAGQLQFLLRDLLPWEHNDPGYIGLLQGETAE